MTDKTVTDASGQACPECGAVQDCAPDCSVREYRMAERPVFLELESFTLPTPVRRARITLTISFDRNIPPNHQAPFPEGPYDGQASDIAHEALRACHAALEREGVVGPESGGSYRVELLPDDDEHDHEAEGCKYLGNDMWNCGKVDNDGPDGDA